MLDNAYRDRLQDALIAAVIETSLVEQDGRRVAAVRTAELVDAMTAVVAGMVASSETMATPRGRRLFAEEVAKRLVRRIARCRQHNAEHGAPFTTMPMEAGRC